MSIIRVKRSGTAGSPAALAQGEMGYSFLAGTQANGGDRLYIGTGTETSGVAANIEAIGGKYFTTKLDHVPGTLTANSAIITDVNNKIDTINVANFAIAGNTISTNLTNANIILNPNGTGVIDVSGKKVTNSAAPVANTDLVTLGHLNNTYTGVLNIAGDTGTDAISLTSETLLITGGTGLSSAVTGNTATINLDNTTVTATSYGAAGSVGTFTVDAQGRLTAAASVTISITSAQVNDATALATASKIVLRDATNNFAANTITASLAGNATTATTFQTARNINGASFNGSADITITAVNPNALTIGTGLSGTSYTGSAAVTIAIDSTVATLTGTQTFTNKTLTDSTTFFQDDLDNTKKLQLQLSGITTATTRTLTVQDASGTLALTSNKLSAFAATTSAELAGVISDETGSGVLVFATSPTLTTPVLGIATATSINKVAFTAPATGSTLTIAEGKTATFSNTLTFTGTDTSSVAFGTGGTVTYTSNKLSVFSATTSLELAGVISDETGSGVLVFATAPTFTTSIDSGATFTAFGSATALTAGYTGTAASTTNLSTGITATATTKTINIGTGGGSGSTTNINLGASAGTGTATFNNDVIVTGNLTVNGTTTTVNSVTVTVDDANIELGSVASPTDVTAAGGGITLKGATDKTISWSAANGWTSSETFNLASGKTYKINTTDVLSSTTLGSGVTSSSLTTVGTIGTGVWQGTLIGGTYGGTGVNNGVKTITIGGNVSTANSFTTSGNFALTLTQTAATNVTLPTTGTLATLIGSETLSNKIITLSSIGPLGIEFDGSTSGQVALKATAVAGATPVITLPATTGTVVTTGDSGTVTSTMIANDTIVNADINSAAAIAITKLAASTISGVSLGNNLFGLTFGAGLTAGGASYNGSAAVTITPVTANSTVLGIASFDATNFTVSTGAVSINTIDGGTY